MFSSGRFKLRVAGHGSHHVSHCLSVPLILCHCELQLFFSPNVALCCIISPSLLGSSSSSHHGAGKTTYQSSVEVHVPMASLSQVKIRSVREELTPDHGLDTLIFPLQPSGLVVTVKPM